MAGDRVLIYMPMIPEAHITMLACVRLGLIHSCVFGGFAAPEVAKRLEGCVVWVHGVEDCLAMIVIMMIVMMFSRCWGSSCGDVLVWH